MIQSDTIRRAIREKLAIDTTLKTPSGAEFSVESVSPVQLVLRVGEKKHRLSIHLDAVDDLVKEFKFIPPGGWLKIGATASNPQPSTLGAIVQPHTSGGSSASQFAAVLENVQVAEINPSRPARIRLTV
jgi:hypothetical protein